jgi:DNA repair exonuclease SbcCD nuclease subunit
MARFQFIHAADLHIDSPLIGLTATSTSFAERVDNASRQAFDNLITLAIEERCSFIVIAGDLFDGEWRDYHTGLFFVDRMRRLKDAGIRVFIVLGNHDAECRFTKRLEFADNVRVL